MRADDEAAGTRLRVVTITVSTNERTFLAECFQTVTASQAQNIDIQFVLVDNRSTDGSAEYVARHHPDVTVLATTRNQGFAGANNIGVRYALEIGTDYVFLLNPDTRTSPVLIGELVDFLEAWPEYGIVGPLQYRYTTDGSASTQLNEWSTAALRAGENHIFDLDTPGLPSPAGPIHGRAPWTLEHAYVQGSALMCRASVLRAVGLFDKTYHTYYEESDLCRRARWGGWRVALCTDLGIQHLGGGGTDGSRYQRRKMLRNKYYFLITDPGWRSSAIARLAIRWLVRDLTRRGAVPAERVPAAIGDTLVGLLWLLTQGPRMARRRRHHRTLRRNGAGGPLASGVP